MASELKFDIRETVISVNDGDAKWNLELNLISWNGREPKYDIRKWSPDHSKMGKGVSMSEEEVILLFQHAEDFLKRFRTEEPTSPRQMDFFIPDDKGTQSPIVKPDTQETVTEDFVLPFD